MPTEKEMRPWLAQRQNISPADVRLGDIESHLAALAHFAPQPSRLAAMTVKEMHRVAQQAEDDYGNGNIVPTAAIEELHRLAHEPAVDRDAEIGHKLLHQVNDALPNNKKIIWHDDAARLLARAVAAQKENRA